ncbi:MAG: bifunctional oligoribonuclease/PAP phosphatase NrnA [Clostridia bacterium]|nr:bifunctional oligoribonuclease/PAP phosphatase NrnA [Clostridia bacterium]
MTMAQKHDFCPEMLSALQHANSILLCTHAQPDGDAIGATLAMGLALRAMGKRVTLADADPVPGYMRFLPGARDFVQPQALKGKTFDAAFAIDTATVELLGTCKEAFFAAPVTMLMDHHPDNPRYATYSVVDGKASAAGCVVYRCIKALGVPLNPEIAACLYCAISTDTGNFRYQNTNAETFSIMTELMNAGLDLPAAARPIHQLREEPHVRLLGRALNSLKIFAGGKCACIRLTQADYQAAGALPEHNTNIVNYAIEIPGVVMAFLAEERENGQVKASLRSLPPWNVAAIARDFGGGGHMFASGLRLEGTLDALCAALEEKMQSLVEGNP